MSSIVIAGDTSGTITLSAPAVAGSNTISLPAVTGTILTTAYTGAVTFDGDFTVDTNTFHVDSTNNRVGIGKTNPTTALDVVGTVTATAFAGALTGNVTGDVSGNAGTVTNGVYTTDIGSTVQAYDADLTTLAGLSSADGNFIVGSATGWVVESGATARTSLGLGTAATTASTDYATAAQGTTADSALQPGDIGSTVQAYDADLTTLGGLSSADGNFIVGSATGWVVESGATARTSLGLGTAATTASTDYATAAQGSLADSALQSSDIGSTVQAYDADTAKLDVVQTFTANQTFADGVHAYFGSGPDFHIFHDGNNTYLSEYGDGTGNVYLRADNLQLLNNANDIYVNCTSNGTVGLYYDNAIKLGTTSAGVSVTGTCTATAFSGDGSGLTGISAGGGFSNMDIITASGTWTNPGSVTRVKVTVVGGGGAGASAYGAPGDVTNGGGGGAGGHAIEYINIPTSPVPVTIGAGGTTAPYPYPSPWLGTPGSTSSFGAYCSATGGVRGTGSTPGTTEGIGGDGGTGSGGLLNFTGRPGRPGYNGSGPTPTNINTIGAGGASIFGAYSTPNSNQGLNGNRNGPAYLYNGSPGGLYGNGGKANGSPRPTAGSYPTAGAPGVILVEY